MTPVTRGTSATPADHLVGWDSLELWVGNARTAAHFFASAFGFRCSGYAGPETGVRDRASYVLEQGDIRLVVTAALVADSRIADHVHRHGDGVHDAAWIVDDTDATYDLAVARGARGVRAPWSEVDAAGELRLAQVATYGETVHTFVDRSRWHSGVLAPGYTEERLPVVAVGPEVGLRTIDHVVGNVPKGDLATWEHFYCDVLGFRRLLHFDAEQISTEYSALESTVVTSGTGIVLPINEPAEGRKRSQIQEYLDHYVGAGVQHVALGTDDIVTTVTALRARGVRFMEVPPEYYVDARRRLDGFELPWDDLERLNILADVDHDGYLLQIFTETVTDRPALFFEVIERHGAEGFGEGNFKALFEAIERDQARRGNL